MGSVELLDERRSVVVVIDLQGKLMDMAYRSRLVIEATKRLMRLADVFDVPVVLTEQYPKGLGETVPEVKQLLNDEPVEKLCFSCMGEEGFRKKMGTLGKKHVILCGIEAHVCVFQTSLDLRDDGQTVHVVVDAISSRKKTDKVTAIRRMVQEGVIPETTEMLLFQLLKKAGTQEFKKISKIIK